jgi:hypothetical protein
MRLWGFRSLTVAARLAIGDWRLAVGGWRGWGWGWGGGGVGVGCDRGIDIHCSPGLCFWVIERTLMALGCCWFVQRDSVEKRGGSWENAVLVD